MLFRGWEHGQKDWRGDGLSEKSKNASEMGETVREMRGVKNGSAMGEAESEMRGVKEENRVVKQGEEEMRQEE